MIGSTLSHYVVDALLGQGGMGAVYRARDTVLNRTVAIKVLTSTGDAESKRRLLHEARAASGLNHPNIVTIHAVERDGDVDFIVMEFVAGEPLTIPAGGLPVDRAIEYADQIAAALGAAHDAGLVHRDVKPANVLILPSGRVKVLDFGIARRVVVAPDAPTAQLTIEPTVPGGTMTGTPGYMSPEQIAGSPVDARSDVFSLGVVLFEMLTGQTAFAGETTWARMDATVRRDLPDVHAVRPEVPDAVARVVARAVAKDPAERYPSARELHADLSAVRGRDTAAAAPGGRFGRLAIAGGVVLALFAAGALAWSRIHESRVRWARETAAPEVARLAAEGEFVPAFRLASRALAAAPDDPQVKSAWTAISTALPITSDPPGADVEFRAYSGSDEGWIAFGKTPTTSRHPGGAMRWRFSKAGYDTIEVAPTVPTFTVHLVPKGTTVAGMVFVPASAFARDSDKSEVHIAPYWLDRYEVTNREYKQFVDAGGYRRPELWQPFTGQGRTLSWNEAMALFVDTTGRPGPSTWELGTYSDGKDDWPVDGVSWYEAAAYAAFAKKQLPTVYHWYNASGADGILSDVLRFSNFSGKGTVRVGSSGGLGPYGTYDMAGNVKEWCWNGVGDGRRYVLGGGFNEAAYQFHDEDARSPFERRSGFGFRCMRSADGAVQEDLRATIATLEADPSTFKPVGDEVFKAYRRLYDYDPVRPDEPKVEEVDDTNAHWRRERITYRAAYSDERVPAWVFIPRNAGPPYQAVVYFPGSDANRLKSSRDLWLQYVEFMVLSGRVVVYPVYAQTYERHNPPPNYGMNFLREITIQRAQDLRRAIDYLETRKDIDRSRIAFVGLSLGAQLGPLFLAVEPRLRTGVFLSGGFETWTVPPEADPVNFAPRVKQPVLMVNGREDFDLPYKTAQLPMFEMLGTAPADKRHAVLEGGHLPPRPQEVYKEVLDWLDRYLGPVR